MSLEGKLVADFASFFDAVDKATVKFRSFEADAAKVARQLNTVSDSFSGRQIVQEATLMAEAIERAGGTAKLTDSELRRAGATAAEAAAKMKLLGMDVPAGIQKIADESRKADTAQKEWVGTVKNLALSFAGFVSIRAGLNFAKDIVADAGALRDLSNQTHINVEELQILAGAMSEFGVDADTLAKGLYTLSRKVAGGDDSVEKALAKMGMSLQQLEGLNGQELFLKIERGLAKLQGGMRDDVSSEIFGSRLGMAMAGAADDIEGAIAVWREHNTVIEEDAVNALDAYDEAIKRTEKSIQAMAANALGPLAEGFNYLNEAATRGAGYWDFLEANFLDTFDAMTGLGTGTENLARLLDQLNQKSLQHQTTARDETEVILEQSRELTAAEQAWNNVATAADAAAQSSVIFGDGLPIEATKQQTDAVKEATAAEEAYRVNVKFTSEALDERETQLKELKTATEEAKAATDAFMNAPTLNDRETQSVSGSIGPLNGFALENVIARFRQPGESDPAAALQRALSTLEGQEGRYNVTDNRSFFDMQHDQLLLAQLRQLKESGNIPGFADGVENFRGGLAYVHKDEMLVNMPRGTSVIPSAGGGAGINVTVQVNGALIGTVRELADMVGAEFMKTIRGQGVRAPLRG